MNLLSEADATLPLHLLPRKAPFSCLTAVFYLLSPLLELRHSNTGPFAFKQEQFPFGAANQLFCVWGLTCSATLVSAADGVLITQANALLCGPISADRVQRYVGENH